jgi:hypothetical protein
MNAFLFRAPRYYFVAAAWPALAEKPAASASGDFGKQGPRAARADT